MKNLNKKRLFFPVFLALALGTSWISYQNGLSQGMEEAKSFQPKQSVLASKIRIGPDSIVKTQQALAVGRITNKDNDGITLRGEDGKESTFKLSPDVSVYTNSTSSASPPKPTKEKAAIKLNQKAIIDLQLQGEEYLVINISYIPEDPTVKKP
ncbi:hypothetical protein HYW42_04375 [Candidatus Daviesbacteria bacterium]|nr:hypothetical protein [Candidatus Daviesbacteria bacterium]